MVSVANSSAITMVDAAAVACDVGTTNPQATIVLYSGAVPINVDAALSGNVVLGQLAMSNPAWGGGVDDNPGAIATAGAITDDPAADNSGTASFYRVLDRDNTPKLQGTVAVSGAELNLVSITIVAGLPIEVTSMTMRQPEG